MMRHRGLWFIFLGTLLLAVSPLRAEVKLPALFTDHMVLQRDQENPVWGWAKPGEDVTVVIGEQTHRVTADADGRWRVKLQPMKAGGPHELSISGADNRPRTLKDVLVGEVWVCSGQSNMGWTVGQSKDADLEIRTANYPNIRLISVPNLGTQEPQRDFQGKWEVCSPKSVPGFSGVGYFFGRQLYQNLNVPIGLIDNAWGGSSCEAWVSRDRLESDDRYAELLARWKQTEETYSHEKALANHQKQLEAWMARARQARQDGKPVPPRPRAPQNPLVGQHRPANLYNGCLKPIIGYGIRGAIWYQGESNAGRAYQYRHLFPLMIQEWREEWGQGDFPFYWVQLADFMAESQEPEESAWAELREAQTMTMEKLPNTGQAVIIDIGEGDDIHPKNKQDVANRLARWALAKDYGIDIVYRSPEFQSAETNAGKMTVTFDHVGGGLTTIDVREPIGFAVAGDDKKFHWAQARIVGKDKIEVWSEAVKNPVAVRYAWTNNPVANVTNAEGLPATPFRSDDWPGVTVNNHK